MQNIRHQALVILQVNKMEQYVVPIFDRRKYKGISYEECELQLYAPSRKVTAESCPNEG